jgi:alkyl sulfatase BDS1-like metallo-beta-lactamase superfamily hydrolase
MGTRRDATQHSQAAHDAVLHDSGLDWPDQQDFDDAFRGFTAKMEEPTVTTPDGAPV